MPIISEREWEANRGGSGGGGRTTVAKMKGMTNREEKAKYPNVGKTEHEVVNRRSKPICNLKPIQNFRLLVFNELIIHLYEEPAQQLAHLEYVL